MKYCLDIVQACHGKQGPSWYSVCVCVCVCVLFCNVAFVWILVFLLKVTSTLGFQNQSGFLTYVLHHLCRVDSSDSHVVQHLHGQYCSWTFWFRCLNTIGGTQTHTNVWHSVWQVLWPSFSFLIQSLFY